jgi:hypothetical protein
MAEIKATVTYPRKKVARVTWSGLAGGDTGSWEFIPGYPDKTVHIYGTFGTSTVSIEGSNETVPANGAVLDDGDGQALSGISATKASVLQQGAANIRPVVSAGTGANVTVIMECFGR